MSTSTNVAPGQVVNRQATYRRDLNPKDQFGRKWLVVVETKTMDICGEAIPAWNGVKGSARDPLRTPMNYVRLMTTEDGNPDTSRCTVDFDAWREQQQQATHTWYERLHDNAITTYKAIEQGSDLEHDRILLRLTGPKPWPSTEVLDAAMSGDRQYLGLEPLDKAHRAALLLESLADLKAMTTAQPKPEPVGDVPPEKYQDFVRWCYAKEPGITLSKIGQLWKDAHEAKVA